MENRQVSSQCWFYSYGWNNLSHNRNGKVIGLYLMLQLHAFFNRTMQAGCLQAESAGSNNPQSCTPVYWQKTSFTLSLRHLELQPTLVPGGSPHQAPANASGICSLQFHLYTALLWLLLPVKWARDSWVAARDSTQGIQLDMRKDRCYCHRPPAWLDKPGCSSSPFLRAGMMPSTPRPWHRKHL